MTVTLDRSVEQFIGVPRQLFIDGRWTDAASGQKMRFHGFVLWRFEGNKIAERWATVAPPAKETS